MEAETSGKPSLTPARFPIRTTIPLARRRVAGGVPGVEADPLPKTSDRLKLSTDSLRVALSLLLIITMSRIHENSPILVRVRIGLLLTAAVAWFAWANPRLIRRDSPFKTWPAKVMVALGIMACISVPFGLSIGNSGKMIIEGYSKTLIGAFLIIVAVRCVRDLYTLLVAFVAAGGALAYLSLWVFPVASAGGLTRIAAGYGFDANDLSTMAVSMLPFAALLTATGHCWKVKILSVATLLGLIATLARSGSRGGFLGLLALGIGFLLLIPHVAIWKRVFTIGFAAGVLLLMAPQGYWEQMKTITHPEQDYNWTEPTGRKQVWKRGWKYMVTHPLTGIGVNNFGKAEITISDRAKEFQPWMPGIKLSAAHNSFIQAGAEMGFPGLILFACLILGGIVAMQRLHRRLPREWRYGTEEQRLLSHLPAHISLSFFAFAIAGSFVSFAYWDLPYILAAFMSGLYLTAAELRGRTDPRPSPSHSR
jgi:putative inorganic carbon (HCO3(-)) transporter